MVRVAVAFLCGCALVACGGGSSVFILDASLEAISYEAPPNRSVVDVGGMPVDPAVGDGGRAVGSRCDILMQDCGGGLGCYRTGCAVAGQLMRDQPCGADSDCLPSNICVLVGVSYTCQRACNTDFDAPCEGKCRAIPDQAQPIGHCEL